MRDLLLAAGVFIACFVEAVEALTIVLAVGVTRDRRSVTTGVVSALVTLAAIVAAAAPTLSTLPLRWVRRTVGLIVLTLGLQWLRKAVLRALGRKALHDEAAIYARSRAEASSADMQRRPLVSDWYAFSVPYKAVVLEGLEVVVIVASSVANKHHVVPAVGAAVLAVLAVIGLGVGLRTPLTKVPENTLKLVVGIMLTCYGLLWTFEGLHP